MSPTGTPVRRRAIAVLALLALVAALPGATRPAQAEELIDLTLLFHSAVQGKIAPCG